MIDTIQKSNYSEAAGILGGDDDEEDGGGRTAKGRARHTISDKLILERGKKKKSAKNIRDAIIYKKSFGTYLEDAVRPVANRPLLRLFTSHSLGLRGLPFVRCHLPYCRRSTSHCTTSYDLHSLRLLGQVSMHEVPNGVLRQELSRCSRRNTMRTQSYLEDRHLEFFFMFITVQLQRTRKDKIVSVVDHDRGLKGVYGI